MAAARPLPVDRRIVVIGLRSIGTALAATVAGALAHPVAAITVRPHGHPFEREIAVTDEFATVLAEPTARYVVVDEGPGLSGSSVAAAIRLAEAHAPDLQPRSMFCRDMPANRDGRRAGRHVRPGRALGATSSRSTTSSCERPIPLTGSKPGAPT